MNLPDITPRLPREIGSPQAVRLRQFLLKADAAVERRCTMTLYGSAAVAFFLADEEGYEYGYTRDVDVGHIEPAIDLRRFASDETEPPLHFQKYQFSLWLLHPDWAQSTVDVSSLLGTGRLGVSLLHPVDLIITKLERAGDQDLEDGILLAERYIDDVSIASQRVVEAAKHYAMSDRARAQIEYSFEAIFETPIDLSDLL